jgi:hypothetical protein
MSRREKLWPRARDLFNTTSTNAELLDTGELITCAMATTLSVDGQDGATLASSSGIRLVQDESQALVLRNRDQATRDGRPGASARQAICGGPAGTLIVQLSESNLTQGGIRVQCRDNSSTHNLPEITEVPIGRDLRLTAIGGKGEEGMKGGDGQSGMKGEDGTDASEADDATNGMNGGRGGDAGRGTWNVSHPLSWASMFYGC